MAQYAFTFSSGDTVTPTKLNNARTVSEIVNADINSAAAIAGTKIAPNFGSQNVVTTGNVVAGASSIPLVGSLQALVNTQQAGSVGYSAVRWTANTLPPIIALGKSRGATVGTNQIVQSGDSLGWIQFAGDDGTDLASVGASIVAAVDGVPGTDNMPGRLVFSTTPSGSSGPAERMRITNAGNVGIANTSPTEKLHVTGNIKASGFIDADTSFRGQASDSASAPSYCWTGDTNTGMFRPTTNVIAFATNGSEHIRISSTGAVGIGTTSPGFKLDVDGNINTTGTYRVNNNIVVGARRTGWGIPSGTAARTTFATSSVSLEALAQRVKAIIDDLRVHGLIGA
jgi:hypothetical protein